MKWINQRPWLYIIGAFMVLITAWVVLLHLATKYAPQTVPLKPQPQPHHGA